MLMRKVGYVFSAITVCVVIFAYLFWDANRSPTAATKFEITGNNGATLWASSVAEFDEPWAMTFLLDGTMLVTTKPGKLFHVTQDGDKTKIDGIWGVAYGGQGGLGDVVLHPQFAQNGLVYISSAETLDKGSTRGAIVARANLDRSAGVPKLTNLERIWMQEPKGRCHIN